jgi:hypothetical protein
MTTAGRLGVSDISREWLPLSPMKALYGVLLPHHRDMRPAMRHTLEAVARTVTGSR